MILQTGPHDSLRADLAALSDDDLHLRCIGEVRRHREALRYSGGIAEGEDRDRWRLDIHWYECCQRRMESIWLSACNLVRDEERRWQKQQLRRAQ